MDVELIQAVKEGNVSRLEEKRREGHGLLLRKKDASGIRLIHIAAEYGQLSVVKYLIENKIDSRVNRVDDDERSPLHWAAWRRRTDVVRYLLEETGIQIDAVTGTGWTPLHYAASSGCVNTIRVLLEYGANAELKTETKETPYNIADRFGYAEAVSLLEDYMKNPELYIKETEKRLYDDDDDDDVNDADEEAERAAAAEQEMRNLEAIFRKEEEIVKRERKRGTDGKISNEENFSDAMNRLKTKNPKTSSLQSNNSDQDQKQVSKILMISLAIVSGICIGMILSKVLPR